MSARAQLARDCLLIAAMISICFGAGWWTYGNHLFSSQRVAFDFSRPFRIPRGYESTGSSPTPETAEFEVGDRIDIFVQDGDIISPMILDAIVTDQTKTNFGLLLPMGGRTLLIHAREQQLQLIYRPSITPEDAIQIQHHQI